MLRSRKKAVVPALTRLAAMLGLLFAVELYFSLKSPDHTVPPPTAVASPDIVALLGNSENPPQSAILAWRATILGRPLFTPSRRPLAISLARATVTLPRLSGIMITPTEKIAVFSPAAGGPLIVMENSRLGPFTILSIAGDRVTVKGPDGVIVLRSDFSDQGQPGKSTPDTTILPGGIDLNLIHVPLPSAATWIGTPTAN